MGPLRYPSTSHWTGAVTIVRVLPTKTCIVTPLRTSNKPMRFCLAAFLRNDGDSVATIGGDRRVARLDGALDGTVRSDDRRGQEVRRVEYS